MPRKPREFVDGGIYHVFNRGNNRGSLFRSEGDFDCFLKLIILAKEKYSIQIFHYCLMTNHFHFLLQTKVKDGLPEFMHWLQYSGPGCLDHFVDGNKMVHLV
jgi:putative transposase